MADDPPGLEITVNGSAYVVRFGDMTAIDAREFRHATGLTLQQVFTGAAGYDIDIVAGLVWLVRRRTELGLTYNDVASSINFSTPVDLVEAEAGDDPEA